ncbi:hypothetical protein [uncultured Mucilaginibacter sp.]|uniref:hypothetical protein n=1 Tax=uncultured Mucilaginibacter sp. TaxID=797541 RepID=UPI0025FA7FE7|nr:hypothetical protein [uncultured Mucilaginibacter sp.]
MKTSKLILSTLIFVSVIFLTACGNHSKENTETGTVAKDSSADSAKAQPASGQKAVAAPSEPIKTRMPKQDKFADQRLNAFTIVPNELNIQIPRDKEVVYGIIIDQENAGAITTLACYQNGKTVFYESNGGTLQKKADNDAIQLVLQAKPLLDKATKAHDTSIPATGRVKFYLLTNKGIYVAAEDVKNISAHTSPWTSLFEQANKTIARLKSDKEYVISPAA